VVSCLLPWRSCGEGENEVRTHCPRQRQYPKRGIDGRRRIGWYCAKGRIIACSSYSGSEQGLTARNVRRPCTAAWSELHLLEEATTTRSFPLEPPIPPSPRSSISLLASNPKPQASLVVLFLFRRPAALVHLLPLAARLTPRAAPSYILPLLLRHSTRGLSALSSLAASPSLLQPIIC
jgi:hypothetical protein